MRIGIIQFPGSNCERETMLAVKRAEMQPVEIMWNAQTKKLHSLDGYIVVGGFSYEDRSRAGIIAALDPLMTEIKNQSEKGKPVLGICNGAQILVETGLVPGLENNKIGVALTENKRVQDNKILGTGYYNTWVHMRLSDEYQRNAYTRKLTPKQILEVPVAHAQGRFLMSHALLSEVIAQGLHVFQYCDSAGNIRENFPVNPNGSMANIAALANKTGNVLAMMPHPERTAKCDAIFASMRDYIAAGKSQSVASLYYYPRQNNYPLFKKPEQSREVIIELMITDNQAKTVENTLQNLGLKVKVKRQIHWEIQCDSDETFVRIKQSGILYNPRKEVEVKPTGLSYLVRAKEDLFGQQKTQILREHFSLAGLQNINHGVLWQFSFENANMSHEFDKILQTNILHNPYAHECYQYK